MTDFACRIPPFYIAYYVVHTLSVNSQNVTIVAV